MLRVSKRKQEGAWAVPRLVKRMQARRALSRVMAVTRPGRRAAAGIQTLRPYKWLAQGRPFDPRFGAQDDARTRSNHGGALSPSRGSRASLPFPDTPQETMPRVLRRVPPAPRSPRARPSRARRASLGDRGTARCGRRPRSGSVSVLLSPTRICAGGPR